jgi:hypothetical protein
VFRPRSDPRGRVRTAGAGAQERFELLLQRWRVRKRKVFAAVFGVLIAPCVVVGAVASGWWDIGAAFLAGAWVGVAMWVWDSPPEHIERVRRGAEGERKTAKELKRLGLRDWTVVHDIEGRFGNWDHVVVGPGGVFLLDSKNLFGEASLEEGCLAVRRVETPDELSRFDRLGARMRGAAAGVSEALRDDRGRPWVTPVVVVWPELAPLATEVQGVAYVSGRYVTEWLRERGPLLDHQRCLTLGQKLTALAEEAATRAAGPWTREAGVGFEGR